MNHRLKALLHLLGRYRHSEVLQLPLVFIAALAGKPTEPRR
jgi:hypothetical protein